MKEIRKKKTESLIRGIISSMILMGEIKDPRLKQLVTVTEVSLSRDMKDARVYVSVLGSEKQKDNVLKTLNHASGYIQALLGKRVKLRFTPRLTFVWDSSLQQGFQMGERLKEISS